MSASANELRDRYLAMVARPRTASLVELAVARLAWDRAVALEALVDAKKRTYHRTDPRGLPEGGKLRQR